MPLHGGTATSAGPTISERSNGDHFPAGTGRKLCSRSNVPLSKPHPQLKRYLLRALEDQAKMRRVQLLSATEAAQISLGPDGVKGPRKILAKLLRKLKNPA